MTRFALLLLFVYWVLLALIPLYAEADALPERDAYGRVDFPTSCAADAEAQIETGVALVHHMMYEQARPHFEAAVETDPGCAMAHWGIAMTSFQPLWYPTSEEDLARGRAAVEAAHALGAPTARESRYIAAAEAYFTAPAPPASERLADHRARLETWKTAQRALHEAHGDDVDAAALYGLATICHALWQASPTEPRDYTLERRAGALLERYFDAHPEHPGLHHYLIHAYDSPALAHKAEQAARRYDGLAPETPHALHMPSHIFVRLGHWEETAAWNERAAEASLGLVDDGDLHAMGHYVHALDYMMYGYLQQGDAERARSVLERIRAVEHVQPTFPSAYALAASQARYYLEQQEWTKAAELTPRTPGALPWERYPAAEALFHYARGIGATRLGRLDQAAAERRHIAEAVEALREAGDDYWAHMTDARGRAVEAWTRYEQGETTVALALMRDAADREDALDKSPVTPGETLPVRELYGEMLALEGRLEEARAAFEASLERTPNRRNALARIETLAAADPGS